VSSVPVAGLYYPRCVGEFSSLEAAEPLQGTQGDVTGRGDADLPAATEQGTQGEVTG